MFISLGGTLFNPDHIVAIKPQGENACSIFTCGSPPIDGGFLVDISAEEAMEAIRVARYTVLAEALDRVGGEDEQEEIKARLDHRPD